VAQGSTDFGATGAEEPDGVLAKAMGARI
jgi:hypothetical protein